MEEEYETAAKIAEAGELSAQEDEGSFPLLTGGSAHETLWCHQTWLARDSPMNGCIIGESFGSSINRGCSNSHALDDQSARGVVHLFLLFIFLLICMQYIYLYIYISILYPCVSCRWWKVPHVGDGSPGFIDRPVRSRKMGSSGSTCTTSWWLTQLSRE